MKVRRTKIGISIVTAKPGWSNSQLVFKEYTDKGMKEVVVTIREPYEIAYLREQITEIVDYWKKKVGEQ